MFAALARASRQTFHFSPDGDDAEGDGSFSAPWQTVAKANAVARPGVTLQFMPGSFVGRIAPTRGGIRGAPLVITGSAVEFSSEDDALISFSGKHFVTLRGFAFLAAGAEQQYLDISEVEGLSIEQCSFDGAETSLSSSQTLAAHIDKSRFLRIIGCQIGSSTAFNGLRITAATDALISGNTIGGIGHSPLQMPDSGSARCIVRRNVFIGDRGRCFEFSGTDGILFEKNIICEATNSGNAADSRAKFLSPHGIFRLNKVTNNAGAAIDFFRQNSLPSKIRWYNNEFSNNFDYDIRLAGFSASTQSYKSKNNLYTAGAVNRRGPTWVSVNEGDIDERESDNNFCIGYTENDEAEVVLAFVREGNGAPLTTTTEGGTGTVIPVADPAWFCPGWAGEQGDRVLVGGIARRVTSVDLEASTVTVDASVTYSDGAAVTLAEAEHAGILDDSSLPAVPGILSTPDPIILADFEADDGDWWWQAQVYRPDDTAWARVTEDDNTFVRLTAPNSGTSFLPFYCYPRRWNLDAQPEVYFRYRIAEGVKLRVFVRAFGDAEAATRRHLIAVSASSDFEADTQLTDDGTWRTVTLDARHMRDSFPGEVFAEGVEIATDAAQDTQSAYQYDIDDFTIRSSP